MLKKPIKFEDFDGNEQTEVFHFHLSKSELSEIEVTFGKEGFVEALKRIAKSGDIPLMLETFKMLINRSYGVRSEDGIKFYKSPELLRDFQAHPAFDALYMEMIQDAKAAAIFINGVIPNSVSHSEEELQRILAKSPEELEAELNKTPEQLARERSEAQLQGHRAPAAPEPKRVADPVYTPPTPTPAFQAPPTEAEIEAARATLAQLPQHVQESTQSFTD